MVWTDVLVALAIAVGLVGILVPVLPGTVLILAAVLVWAIGVSSSTGWVVLALVTVFLAAGTVVKYAVPGRRLQATGVPTRTLVVGGVAGVIGFFMEEDTVRICVVVKNAACPNVCTCVPPVWRSAK